jgi:membrane-associated phospholipid phosphatase
MLLWQILSIFGDLEFWIGASLVSLIFLFAVPKKARKNIAWFVFLTLPAVIMSSTIVYTMKNYFKIPRPCWGLITCPSDYSFPSAHAAVIFAAMTTLAFHYKNKRLGIILFILGCLVAISRVILGVHTFEDIIVGSIIGIIIGILIQKANENYRKEIKEIVSDIK